MDIILIVGIVHTTGITDITAIITAIGMVIITDTTITTMPATQMMVDTITTEINEDDDTETQHLLSLTDAEAEPETFRRHPT